MYIRNRETTKRMIDQWFKNWYRVLPEDRKPFNGVVRINRNYPLGSHYAFSWDKEYHVIDGFMVDDTGDACGADYFDKELSYGFYNEFSAYPITHFDNFEDGLFEVVEEY